ncbi:CLUMA_CG000599, isoform A [Clunio marinus]|uniref:CLUMA_CG000599, isoform A n=1 Tax=Clunio marinus TaxID=568069 RepID=A0A1J1HFM0_9DIPT|nr:CLUMA_CG000599, isoform A [Clunio marinus]
MPHRVKAELSAIQGFTFSISFIVIVLVVVFCSCKHKKEKNVMSTDNTGNQMGFSLHTSPYHKYISGLKIT